MRIAVLMSVCKGTGFARTSALVCASLLGLGLESSANAQAQAPATLSEAAAKINLATLPIMPGADPAARRNLASLSYSVKGGVKDAIAFHRRQLADLKWQEEPNAYVDDQSGSCTFTSNGYSLSVMAYPTGKDGKVSVSIMNHGNLDLASLPVPETAKALYKTPGSASSVTEDTVEKAVESCHEALLKQGWEPYGEAVGSRYYKKNAVHLGCRVFSAPGQGGKTVVEYSAHLISSDIPAMPGAEKFQYSDSDPQLFFDVKATKDEVFDYYRKALAAKGWEPTTKADFKTGFKQTLIFRNPEKDLITVEVGKFEGKSRTLLRLQTAAQVAEETRRFEAKLAEKEKMQKSKVTPKLALTLPDDATEVKATKSRIEFKMTAGKAKSVVEAWRATLIKDGWKEKVTSLDAMAGTVALDKGDQSVTFVYVDSGFFAAEITVSAFGTELTRADSEK